MSNHIEITPNIAIQSDKSQWMLSRKRRSKNRDTGEIEFVWQSYSYYPTLSMAVQRLGEELLRTSECTTVGELIEASERISQLLSQKFTKSINVEIKGK